MTDATALDLSSLDAALAVVHRHHLDYGPGFSDHAPMAMEAMESVGRTDAIGPWLARYVRRLDPLDGPGPGGPAADAAEADRVARFESELATGDWRATAAGHVADLATAVPTAAGHGLLRTAHAVRALGRADTPVRRAELARGLAYWSWHRLDLPEFEPVGGAAPSAALAAVRPLAAPNPNAMISGRVASVVDAELLAVAASVHLPDDPADALAEVTRAAAVALRSAGPAGTFAVLHGLTTSVAVRDLLALLAPVDAAAAATLVRSAWTTVLALWAAYGEGRPLGLDAPPPTPSAEELVARAVARGDEHAVKVAVAAWHEERATGGDRADLRAAALVGVDFFGA